MAYRLGASDVIHIYDADRESCIVVLTDTVSVEAGDEQWASIGSRDSVFEDAAPHAVYMPPKLAAIVRAERDAEIGVASTPARGLYPPRLIESAQIAFDARQERQYALCVRHPSANGNGRVAARGRDAHPGRTCVSYPPHKHDQDNVPIESSLEETYYHRLNPPQGFAFQRVYQRVYTD